MVEVSMGLKPSARAGLLGSSEKSPLSGSLKSGSATTEWTAGAHVLFPLSLSASLFFTIYFTIYWTYQRASGCGCICCLTSKEKNRGRKKGEEEEGGTITVPMGVATMNLFSSFSLSWKPSPYLS
jgi:hypothetical protein